MIHQSRRSTRRSQRYHDYQEEGDLEGVTYETDKIRLMIQIILFSEILTSCFVRSEMIWLA